MIKALVRTALLVIAILVVVHFVPTLAPYQTVAIVVALATGLFEFITRSFFVILLLAAAAFAYFFLH